VSPELGFVLLQEVLEEGAEAEYGLGMGGDLAGHSSRGLFFFSMQDIVIENYRFS
jgi:hypothetical protein